MLAGAPAAVALAGAALAAAAVALGWVVGFVRLASDGWSGWRTAAAAFVLVAFAVSWCGVALAAGADALLAPATFAVLSVGGFFVLAVAAIALALLAPRVDMTRVIDENSLHADLCQFGMLSPLDRNDIAEYQRRRKLADRPVRFSLPRGEGRLALVQRAALSHARQYDGLASLVMQGAFVVPLGVLALLGAGGPVLFVFWLPVAVLMPQGVREATRAFHLDTRQRWTKLILPAVFGSWCTGGITAAGGAWNASIVSEIVTYGHTTLTANGLGTYIANATAVETPARPSSGLP